MLSKRPHLMIRKLSELLVPGNRPAIPPEIPSASPRSPLDVKFPSPGTSKRYDIGGVGLGIVAALEKSSSRGIKRHEILARYPVRSGSDSNKSDPICCAGKFRGLEMDISEDYTCIKRHDGPTKCIITEVYYDDGVEFCNYLYDVDNNKCDNDEIGFGRRRRKPMDVPGKYQAEILRESSGFLSSCSLCKKKLQGKDIYMYKGEKGFCSEECRSVEITKDERKEQCTSEVSRSADVSRSPYDDGEQTFSTGIFVF